MRVLVMGAGALGGYFGARLAAAGHEVVFVARGAQLAAMRERGLTVESLRGDIRLETVQAFEDPAEAGPAEVVLFAVKTYDVEQAARRMLPVLGPESVVVTCQNGVSAQPKLAAIIGRERVLPGVVRTPADVRAPGVIRHAAGFDTFIVGEWDGGRSDRAEAIVAALAGAGVQGELTEDIWRLLWEKFVMQSANAALTTLTRLDIGPVRDVPETLALLKAAAEETAAVARASHPTVPGDAAEAAIRFLTGVPATFHASMLDDLNRGKRLELDEISGEIVRRGSALGIPTPVHAFVQAALKPFENGAPGPSG